MATNLPDIYTGTSFNAEPFDPYAVAVWVDLSTRYEGTGSAQRGRSQYELSQSQTGTADMTWIDQDEALNPANPTSPYAPNVVPYRQLVWRLTWPAAGTGNLMDGAGLDGSFESYSVPNAPSWFAGLLQLSGVGPPVGFPFLVGSGAWQGTKAGQIVISGAATSRPAGCSFPLQLVPGRQYTAQVHINQTSATPFQLAIGNQTIAVDPFTRTTANGLGTPPAVYGYGPTWIVTGTAADYSTAAGFAFMSHGAVNVRHTALTGATGANRAVYDCDLWVTVTIPVVATGQAIQASLYARYANSLNNLACLISFNTDLSITLTAQKEVGGVFTTIGSNVTLPLQYAAGDSYRMHMKVAGPEIWLKAWKANTPVVEPSAWTIQVADNSLVAPGQVGITSLVTTGNTNTLPVALSFSDFRAIGSIVDTTNGVTSTSGAYVLLTQTFTASQPSHTFVVETQGGPTGANTILVDGIQVEPGATANTFTTSGPIVRSPWTRGYIERWPIQWDPDSMGFLGIMSGPSVGPFFFLQNAALYAEYRSALMAKSPALYWPLDESTSTVTSFSEQSGSGGPPLQRWDALEGPATGFAPGTRFGMAGDPSGVSVAITGQLPGLPTAATILHTGYKVGVPITLGTVGTSWGLSITCWASSSDSTSNLTGALVSVYGPAATAAIFDFDIGAILAGQGPSFSVGIGSGFQSTPRTAQTFLDGKPHLFVATWNLSGNAYTMRMYVDGALYGSNTGTASTTFGSSSLDGRVSAVDLMGQVNFPPNTSASAAAGVNGDITHVGAFNRTLSSAEVADLWAAGQGYPNENSGTRVARYLSLSGYSGNTDIGQGLTTMGVSQLTDGTTALAACQFVQDTEFGNLYEYQDGVAFRGRQARYLATAPAFTFGERVDLGEYPYLGDIAYDHDATYVFNSALLSRAGGSTAYATDTTGRSQMRYAPRTFTRDMGGNSDLECQDLANYVVANSKDARPRLAALTFDAGATRGVTAAPDGTLWRMLLKLEPGTRVTVKRRPTSAGFAMVGDFFVEGITPSGVNLEKGTFLFTLLLSPAPVSSQPWILEDSTYGVLDSTTVLGA